MGNSRWSRGLLVLGLCAVAGAGCLHLDRPLGTGLVSSSAAEPMPALGTGQVADIQVALGRSLEQRGELDQAQAAYLEAVNKDPRRGEAWARLAVLNDLKGNFTASGECYRKAKLYQGENAALSCNLGYSLYLQRRWAEAERALREAIALDEARPRAHNNLGLVLAHTGRAEAAIAEFRKAGCSEAEAHANLALARAVEGNLDGARASYERAAAIDPTSVQARKGLQQITELMARAPSRVDAPSGAAMARAAGTGDPSSPPAAAIRQPSAAVEQSPADPLDNLHGTAAQFPPQ
jgi:Flp pilus assembly protein TadD